MAASRERVPGRGVHVFQALNQYSYWHVYRAGGAVAACTAVEQFSKAPRRMICWPFTTFDEACLSDVNSRKTASQFPSEQINAGWCASRMAEVEVPPAY